MLDPQKLMEKQPPPPRVFGAGLDRVLIGPGGQLAIEGRSGFTAVVDFQVVARAVVGRIENGLKIEVRVRIAGLQGDGDDWQPLHQADRIEQASGSQAFLRDVNQVFMWSHSAGNGH